MSMNSGGGTDCCIAEMLTPPVSVRCRPALLSITGHCLPCRWCCAHPSPTPAELEWIRELEAWLRAAVAQHPSVRFLGMCFGCQVLATGGLPLPPLLPLLRSALGWACMSHSCFVLTFNRDSCLLKGR